jgi:Lsr2
VVIEPYQGETVASKTIVTLEDDIDGGSADESLRFAFDGKSYAIDLSSKNAERFRKAVKPFIDAGRREGSIARAKYTTYVSPDVQPSAVRAWAASNGYSVSARGRISADIVAAYKAAGN